MNYQQDIIQDDESGEFVGRLLQHGIVVYSTPNCRSMYEVQAKINSFLASTKQNGIASSRINDKPNPTTFEKLPAPFEVKDVPLQRRQQTSQQQSQKKRCCRG